MAAIAVMAMIGLLGLSGNTAILIAFIKNKSVSRYNEVISSKFWMSTNNGILCIVNTKKQSLNYFSVA